MTDTESRTLGKNLIFPFLELPTWGSMFSDCTDLRWLPEEQQRGTEGRGVEVGFGWRREDMFFLGGFGAGRCCLVFLERLEKKEKHFLFKGWSIVLMDSSVFLRMLRSSKDRTGSWKCGSKQFFLDLASGSILGGRRLGVPRSRFLIKR